MKTNQIMNKFCLFSVFVVRLLPGTKTCQAQEYFFTPLARLLSATSARARRVAFPLLFFGTGVVLVEPCAGGSRALRNNRRPRTPRLYHTETVLPHGKVPLARGN